MDLDEVAVKVSKFLKGNGYFNSTADRSSLDDLKAAALLFLAMGDQIQARTLLDECLKLCTDSGDVRQAMSVSDIILALLPTKARDLNRNGLLAQKNSMLRKAENAFLEASRRGSVAAKYNLCDLHARRYRLTEAVALLDELQSIDPENPSVYSKLADCHVELRNFGLANYFFRKSIELRPADARIRNRYGQFLMLSGNYDEGLVEYQWRTQLEKNSTIRRLCVGPSWEGESLSGRTVLVYREQGIGDNIQFVRYLADLRKLGAKVIYRCNPQLRSLFELSGVADVYITNDQEIASLSYDFHISILSLPLIFYRMTGQLNFSQNYLNVHAQPVHGLFFDPALLKVGVVWKGSENSSNNSKRNVRPAYLERLSALASVQLFSLQLERENQELVGLDVNILDVSSKIKDFLDTAKIIQNLDVVLTVDTAVAHLAGALGKKTFLLLQYTPDFRWGLDSTVSAWYPSIRLFREIERLEDGNWNYSFDCVIDALRAMSTVNAGGDI